MKTRVMFFLPVLGGGGAEMNAIRLAGGLRDHGIEPVYVTARDGGSYARFLPDGIETRVLDTGSIRSSTLRLLRSVMPLARLIDELRPDILCPVLTRTSLAGLAAVRQARHKPKVVLSIQNALSGQFQRTDDISTRIERALVRRWWPRADRAIALSHGVAGEIGDYVPALAPRTEVIPNVGKPLPIQISDAARAPRQPDPEGRIRLLACGRLVEQKGYPDLLAAFARLDMQPAPLLAILGLGPLETELRALARDLGISDRVEFLGFRDDPLAHMRQADIFVLSSLWEGFGNVIVEAMSVGTPVVATDCAHGPGEIITDGTDGLLVPPGEPEALAAALRRLIGDAGLRQRLGEAGVRRADDFALEKIGRAYAESFHRIAGEQMPARAAA